MHAQLTMIYVHTYVYLSDKCQHICSHIRTVCLYILLVRTHIWSAMLGALHVNSIYAVVNSIVQWTYAH